MSHVYQIAFGKFHRKVWVHISFAEIHHLVHMKRRHNCFPRFSTLYKTTLDFYAIRP